MPKENILDIIKKEHKLVKELMKKILKNPRRSKNEFKKLDMNLTHHMQGEEKFFYPEFKKIEETKHLSVEGFEEHKHAKMIQSELKRKSPENEDWMPKFKVMSEMIEHHINEEEKEFFKHAKKHFDKQMLEEIAKKYLAHKQKMMKM